MLLHSAPGSFSGETDSGRLVSSARWAERLPHTGRLQLEFHPSATQEAARASRRRVERGLARKGFRPGAAHLPPRLVAKRWGDAVAPLVRGWAEQALRALAPRLGADLLDPLPEVLAHSDPLADDPFRLLLGLRLVPSVPDPLAPEAIWPPGPFEAAQSAIGGAAPRFPDDGPTVQGGSP